MKVRSDLSGIRKIIIKYRLDRLHYDETYDSAILVIDCARHDRSLADQAFVHEWPVRASVNTPDTLQKDDNN
jgi:hypothetical protein